MATHHSRSSNRPVFVGGVFRSGTSLLRAMLSQHSSFFAGLETKWCYQEWGPDDTAARDAWLETLETFFSFEPGTLVASCTDLHDPRACIERMLSRAADMAGNPRWIEKTPGNVLVIDAILEFWSDAKVLQIVRDPRDVYASLMRSGKWDEPDEFAKLWVDSVCGARMWARQDPRSATVYRELRYEDLVGDPVATLEPVIEFLGEDWESAVASFEGRPDDYRIVHEALGHHSS